MLRRLRARNAVAAVGVTLRVRRLIPAAILPLMLAACGSKAHLAAASHSSPSASQPSATVTATAAATTTPETASPSPGNPNCRLPVAIDQVGGFVTLPGAAFTSDPASKLTFDGATNTFRTEASPVLHGPNSGSTLSYDPGHGRWLPVDTTAVSPDGASYAYAQGIVPPDAQGPIVPSGSHIHVVAIKTGADRIVYSGQLLAVVGWRREGIYLTHPCAEGCGEAGGLWLLDPSAGSLQQVVPLPTPNPERVGAVTWSGLGGGAAWAVTGDPSNPNSPPDRLLRHDLNGGPEEPWFTKAGSQMSLLTVAGTQPIVSVFTAAETDVWLVTGRNQAQLLVATHASQTNGLLYPTVARRDANGIWFGSSSGVFLWANGSINELYSQRASPAGVCS